LQDWTADFIAESDRQDADTQDETIKRHFERVLTATTHNAGHGASRDSLLEAMEHVHVVWKHMIGNEILRPRELAIVFGMMDSLGQAFGAKVDATQEAMGSVLGHTNLILYLAAGRDPTLLSWVMAGGRAVWELYVDKKKAPEEVIEALAKQYLADIQERPDVVPHI
jgi:hypothetical protein